MQPSDNRNLEHRSIDWLGILRILLVQVLVLLALAAAVVRYLEWSSDQAWAEFSRAGILSSPATDHRLRPATPLQPVRDKAACARKA